ncbi:hypothetical protein G6F57_021468 [Rhizopus arrhizus]|nr:hypothetical protein G6F57_021468 [Rhizopus arrhizus]
MEDQVPDVPLVFISNAYLEKKAQSVEQRSILGEGYQRASLVSQEEVDLIKAIEKKSATEIQNVLNDKGVEAYVSLIFYLLKNLSRPDTIQYVCLKTDEILSGIIYY